MRMLTNSGQELWHYTEPCHFWSVHWLKDETLVGVCEGHKPIIGITKGAESFSRTDLPEPLAVDRDGSFYGTMDGTVYDAKLLQKVNLQGQTVWTMPLKTISKPRLILTAKGQMYVLYRQALVLLGNQ